ncbi:MAG: UDP-3-O-(3-hydroxymyristoyl)glucosamine N-acyltransferase [Flavobacteriales bacterium]|nr:UDP-3-O-(3-hydroxymyristoyl)glucosamine N-acyltransferase [Flavobacteriales bacterium]
MQFSATQVAAMLNGTIEGDQDAMVHSLSKIEEGKSGMLTFLANPKYTEFIYSTEATIAIVPADFKPEKTLPSSLTLIRVNDARAAFAKLLEAYNNLRLPKPGIDSSAKIPSTAKISDECYIGAMVSVGENVVVEKGVRIYPGTTLGDNVRIGASSVLNSGVHVYHDCIIGARCTLHSGVVIGSDGFGFTPNEENNYAKVPHIGNVVIEDHVEIGSNTTIDRATLGSTVIRKGVKLDNLIQIAHNVEIGENTVIAAQTGIAGSTKIGKNCLIGGQVGIIGHLTIADGTKIAAQSGIGQSITEPNTIVQGSPAFGIMDYKKSYVGFRKLPELMQRISELEKQLKSK